MAPSLPITASRRQEPSRALLRESLRPQSVVCCGDGQCDGVPGPGGLAAGGWSISGTRGLQSARQAPSCTIVAPQKMMYHALPCPLGRQPERGCPRDPPTEIMGARQIHSNRLHHDCSPSDRRGWFRLAGSSRLAFLCGSLYPYSRLIASLACTSPSSSSPQSSRIASGYRNYVPNRRTQIPTLLPNS